MDKNQLGDLTNIKFTRDGFTYDIDYEYLQEILRFKTIFILKAGDVIHLPDNTLKSSSCY